MQSSAKLATLGGGCYWCLDGVFRRVIGVTKVQSGFCGDNESNANYQAVCSGKTLHAEVVQITFDDSKVTFKDLLSVFFTIHDPTTLNRQGNDTGPQYRSVIFYHDESQRLESQETINQLTSSKVFKDPIVTQLSPYGPFYSAEEYHQNYYDLHRKDGYCRAVIDPKIQKLLTKFGDRVKQEFKQ